MAPLQIQHSAVLICYCNCITVTRIHSSKVSLISNYTITEYCDIHLFYGAAFGNASEEGCMLIIFHTVDAAVLISLLLYTTVSLELERLK